MESAWVEMEIEINDKDLNLHKKKGHICWYYAWIGSFQGSIKFFKLWEILQMLFLSFSQYHTQSSSSALQANKHCCDRCLPKDKSGFQTTGWHILANSRWDFFTSALMGNIKSIEALHMMCGFVWCYWEGCWAYLNTDLLEHVLQWKNSAGAPVKARESVKSSKNINCTVLNYCVTLVSWTHP